MSDTPTFSLDGEGAPKLVSGLRDFFSSPGTEIVRCNLDVNFSQLELGFRPSDQYLVEVNGNEIHGRFHNYSNLPTPKTLSYKDAMDVANVDMSNPSIRNLTRFRFLCFMTSEAARFHAFGRALTNLLSAPPGSPEALKSIINFEAADVVMRNYGRAKRMQGLGDKQFQPVHDAYALKAVEGRAPFATSVDDLITHSTPSR